MLAEYRKRIESWKWHLTNPKEKCLLNLTKKTSFPNQSNLSLYTNQRLFIVCLSFFIFFPSLSKTTQSAERDGWGRQSESFASVVGWAFASHFDFSLFAMDVESKFLSTLSSNDQGAHLGPTKVSFESAFVNRRLFSFFHHIRAVQCSSFSLCKK